MWFITIRYSWPWFLSATQSKNLGENCLTKTGQMFYNHTRQLNSLIKSGGGNGPMKPGNLRKRFVYARC